jgi:epoxyqueuosine reductase
MASLFPDPPSAPPSGGTAASLAAWLKKEAGTLGFHRVGITSPPPDPLAAAAYLRWLEEGYHGEMEYLARPEAVARRMDPALTLPEVRSVVVVAHRYAGGSDRGRGDEPGRGHVARYARGRDYHDVIREGLETLHQRLEGHLGREVPGRAYTDAGPLLERDLARRAGLGWFGRNTMLIHPRAGSWELLGALLLALDLPGDPPFEEDHCGSCTACLQGCPTGALLGRDEGGGPVMDARRCISYFTIESKGPIPRPFRAAMGNRVFGCDICQEVCPWNGDKPSSRWPSPDPAYRAREPLEGPELVRFAEHILGLSGKGYLREFQGSPLARPRRQGMLRNLCVGLGNTGDAAAVPVLARALEDRHPLVRGHAAWALGRVGGAVATGRLLARREVEQEGWVREELEAALESVGIRAPGIRAGSLPTP